MLADFLPFSTSLVVGEGSDLFLTYLGGWGLVLHYWIMGEEVDLFLGSLGSGGSIWHQ